MMPFLRNRSLYISHTLIKVSLDVLRHNLPFTVLSFKSYIGIHEQCIEDMSPFFITVLVLKLILRLRFLPSKLIFNFV